MDEQQLKLALIEGESLRVEFKERISNLDREIVAFANSAGGIIYLGVNDSGKTVGIHIDNRLKSQITDIAHNCDPSIKIQFQEHLKKKVLAIIVDKGINRPYRCKDGFFIRNGPSSQKLKRDEIVTLINQTDKIRFDEAINERFHYPKDFSKNSLQEYLKVCGIISNASNEDILISLNVVTEQDTQLLFNNAGVMFFAKEAQRFLPESYITAIKYKTQERFSILDKKDFFGSPIAQIEQTIAFTLRHMNIAFNVDVGAYSQTGARKDLYEYSPVAIREAIVNAVTHRDYLYDSSHVYVHMFPDYIEIENPGGLYRGLTLENFRNRSVRRNRLIADLLHRAGYIERVGSGFSRMEKALAENNNPPYEVSATNFFNIKFYKRLNKVNQSQLTSRQLKIFLLFNERNFISKREVSAYLDVSEDTALREINHLIALNLVQKVGTGKSTMYTQIT